MRRYSSALIGSLAVIGGYVLIRDAAKRKAPENLPFPAGLRGATAPTEGAAA